MEHLAIDLGLRESQVCVRSADGTIVAEGRVRTSLLGSYLGRRGKSRVVVETGSGCFKVADAALQCGHEVRVVPATLVRSLGVGARRTKNDRRDAQVLSEVSCRMDLPSVHIPSAWSRQAKAICSTRESLVGARTQIVNCVRGWLRTQSIHLQSGSVTTFTRRVRAHLGTQLPTFIDRQVETVDHLTGQIKKADAELAELAQLDPRCARLMTMPGIGPVSAVRFAAAVDDVTRFPHAHAVQSYLGLVPSEYSSGEQQSKGAITKAGAPAVRWALVQAAWNMRYYRRNDPIVLWAREVEKRRGKKVAIVALARKVAGILYAIWRDGSKYDPRRGANANVNHE